MSDISRYFVTHEASNGTHRVPFLQARFNDVLSLAPILNQLTSLTLYETINAQVPFLLRSVLPNGLPNLKSLKIGQHPSLDETLEVGARWFETDLGDFCLAGDAEEASRDVTNGYIHSIARGAPNLEEICLQGKEIGLGRYVRRVRLCLTDCILNCSVTQVEIASEISQFRNLRRFYFGGPCRYFTEEDRVAMITSAKALAEACGKLTTVVDLAWGWDLPYIVAKISRNENGEVASVDLGHNYYGVQIGNEDEAFPQSC
jgi:hypothetical protein